MPYVPRRHASPPPAPGHCPVVVVGGGLVGLTLALDLAQRHVAVVLLDDEDSVSTGSRAICFAKRTLEIFGRLGLGRRMLEKGVTWNTGRVFLRDRELFSFDLLAEDGHEYPAFVNLQQYYAEEWLVEACAATGLVELRWKHAVSGVSSQAAGAEVSVTSPGGDYTLTADWLLACDGANSHVRRALDLPFAGKVFRDRFLIADVVMQAPFPSERRFWFDPPFHPNQSALLHKQPDDVWRIDLQLGPDADPDEERKPERVIPRIRAMLGPDARFELEWVSVYTFRCRRLERFVHGRVVFAGDSAHQVSPFGARGGNGGVQDADNLAWKLASVLQGRAPAALIGTYDDERIPAADENILHSTRATDFISPKSAAARAYRDAALLLAERHSFARPFVNSGRLSRPCTMPAGAADGDAWPGAPAPGSPAVDAPVLDGGRPDWLLPHIGGAGFTLLHFGAPAGPRPHPEINVVRLGPDGLDDLHGLAARRYAAPDGACILFRPDQHVAATFRQFDAVRIGRAMDGVLAAKLELA
jgi:3-(3-hydroxy-phenyl)propionate hydroxylase